MNRKAGLAFIILLAVIGILCYKLFFTGKKQVVLKSASNPFSFFVSDSVSSGILGETRKINVYLPEDYSPDSANKYPVIYLLDGGIDEDFIHISGLVRFNTQPWINRFPKSIVVGIENTDRKRDFTFAVPNLDFLERVGFKEKQFPTYGGSAKFIAFIEKELQPFIGKKYRANENRMLIGESLAGLLATEILLKHRNLFNTYIIMSASLWWGNESLLSEAPGLLGSGTEGETRVYVAACNKDEDRIMYEDDLALSETLKKFAGDRLKVYFDYLPDELHSTIEHQAVINAFKLLYPSTAYHKP